MKAHIPDVPQLSFFSFWFTLYFLDQSTAEQNIAQRTNQSYLELKDTGSLTKMSLTADVV